MKRKTTKLHHTQSGQATLELIAILTGLIAMMLGVLFVAGLSLADNRTLLRAKANAERGARGGAETEIANGEAQGWSYGRTNIGGEEISIPFSSSDSLSWQLIEGQLDSAPEGFRSEIYSEGEWNGYYQYEWTNPRIFNTAFQTDFTSSLTTGYNAARLVHGSDSDTEVVFGFDTSGQWIDGTYENNPTIRSRTRRAMRNTFHQWFGVRISDQQLTDSPANQVYMPAGKDMN